MHVNVDESKIEIDINNINSELNDWVEQIGKTANRHAMIQIVIAKS